MFRATRSGWFRTILRTPQCSTTFGWISNQLDAAGPTALQIPRAKSPSISIRVSLIVLPTDQRELLGSSHQALDEMGSSPQRRFWKSVNLAGEISQGMGPKFTSQVEVYYFCDQTDMGTWPDRRLPGLPCFWIYKIMMVFVWGTHRHGHVFPGPVRKFTGRSLFHRVLRGP